MQFFKNLSGAQSSGAVCVGVILWSFCNTHAVLVTFAYRDKKLKKKNFAIIAYNTIIKSAKNASRSSILVTRE